MPEAIARGSRSLWISIACGLVVLAAPADASHQRGIRVTVTGINHAAQSVEVDVTAYTTAEGEGPSAEATGEIGHYTETGAEESPAIAWGEGEDIPVTSLPLAGVSGGIATYRGSFSHTYGGLGPFTIRVRSARAAANFTEMAAEGEETGAIAEQGYVGTPYLSEGGPAVPGEDEYPDFFINTAQVLFQQSVLEIPTASTVGLGLLSLALAGAGFWLIRR